MVTEKSLLKDYLTMIDNYRKGLFGGCDSGYMMNIKPLILFLWIFFLAVRNTGDILWQFCLIYCGVLVLCAFFYRLENKGTGPEKGRKKNS